MHSQSENSDLSSSCAQMMHLFNPRYLAQIFPAQFDSYPDRFIKAENIKTEVSIFVIFSGKFGRHFILFENFWS